MTEKILTPRQGGKTTALIKRSAETKEVILTATQMEKKFIQNLAQELELEIPEPVTVKGLFTGEESIKTSYLVDEIDMVLSAMVSRLAYNQPSMSALTLTTPDIFCESYELGEYSKNVVENSENSLVLFGVFIEELSELQKALCKYLRANSGEKMMALRTPVSNKQLIIDIIEEMADTYIILAELKKFLNTDSLDVQMAIRNKIREKRSMFKEMGYDV